MDEDRIEWCIAVPVQGRFKRMGYFNLVPEKLKCPSQLNTDDGIIINKK